MELMHSKSSTLASGQTFFENNSDKPILYNSNDFTYFSNLDAASDNCHS